MNRPFHEALLLYLEHCDANRLFVIHPLDGSSERVDGDWHLRNEDQLIAIVNFEGNVECVANQHAMIGG